MTQCVLLMISEICHSWNNTSDIRCFRIGVGTKKTWLDKTPNKDILDGTRSNRIPYQDMERFPSRDFSHLLQKSTTAIGQQGSRLAALSSLGFHIPSQDPGIATLITKAQVPPPSVQPLSF